MSEVFCTCFNKIEDPRVDRTKKHLLLDIISIAICAVIAGCEHWEEIEDFGNDHESWFKTFLTLENGIPSHDTFSRVFSILDPAAFQEACVNWLKMVHELLPEGVIAIDGKTIRGSARKQQGIKGLHIINAWSCANSISLCQLKVADKSNEITAVPEVLKVLELKGAIITMDAMGCQKESIKQICESNADYVVALKGNQGLLFDTVTETFDAIDQGSKAFKLTTANDEIDCDHGRIEQRKVEVVDTSKLISVISPEWKSLNSIARITYLRSDNNSEFKEHRYYISSLSPDNPKAIMRTIRSHWQVENCLHWSLDVTFSEDKSRIRDENAAINYSWLRKFALGLLKKELSFKNASIKRKQKRAARNTEYLQKIIKI